MPRIHIDSPDAVSRITKSVLSLIKADKEIVFVCIGTDRSIGDAFGPLVGTKLQSFAMPNVYGTLEYPIHAANLADTLKEIEQKHPDCCIIAIDACLGQLGNVGTISVDKGPLRPGTGMNKTLPAVGDISVTGIVNVGGYMEYLTLQNTRLSLVMKMADIAAMGLVLTKPALQLVACTK